MPPTRCHSSFGPPVGWPLKFRISGPDPVKTREIAQSFAQLLGANPETRNINYDWNEPAKVIKVEVDQDRARVLGLSSQQLANNINAILSGTTITQLRDTTYLVDIVARAVAEERAQLATLRNLMLDVPGGRSVPLAQIATLPLVNRTAEAGTLVERALALLDHQKYLEGSEEEVLLACAEVLHGAGAGDRAAQIRERARASALRKLDALTDPAWRGAFLAVPEIRELFA